MTLLEFVGELRAAGLWPGTDRVANAARALAALPGKPYWALRTTLCSQPSDIEIFNAIWYAEGPQGEAELPSVVVVGAEAGPATGGRGEAVEAGESRSTARAGARGVDDLGVRDLRGLTPQELAEIDRLIALLAPVARQRRVMRRVPWRTGRIDAARTLRHLLASGGEPARILRSRKALRPRRLLLLIDVSASMAEYVDPYLRLAHAAMVAGPDTTEVFTIGTRWTRLSPLLRNRNADAALRSAGLVRADWGRGTTLGPALRDFLRRWGTRTSVRGAIIVIFSDGLEAGRAEVLPRQVARLRRLGHRLVWVNPLLGMAGYKPLGAMKMSLPFVSAHLPGHDLASLRGFAASLREAAR
jgi:uncharacterized protein with von Willebrand factor type A (vWA) domain